MFLRTHVTPLWRAISSYNQKNAEKREKEKTKVGHRAPAALPTVLSGVKNTTISSEVGFSDLKMTLVYEYGFIFCENLSH